MNKVAFGVIVLAAPAFSPLEAREYKHSRCADTAEFPRLTASHLKTSQKVACRTRRGSWTVLSAQESPETVDAPRGFSGSLGEGTCGEGGKT